jgi:hypothetical protein
VTSTMQVFLLALMFLVSQTASFEEKVRYASSFGGVEVGDPALYVNDILNIGLTKHGHQ